jgi:hypothetical protein
MIFAVWILELDGHSTATAAIQFRTVCCPARSLAPPPTIPPIPAIHPSHPTHPSQLQTGWCGLRATTLDPAKQRSPIFFKKFSCREEGVRRRRRRRRTGGQEDDSMVQCGAPKTAGGGAMPPLTVFLVSDSSARPPARPPTRTTPRSLAFFFFFFFFPPFLARSGPGRMSAAQSV